ncbi:unnamed protein product [Dovyalis caffra]|uniref:Uncharacterized protein n=1 Tax=Dovyalis caffra TaxID=77055 RepID=A0AAV1RWV7_9ROSI|nr:unnamed protein product [Dovyalis caffra]
MMDRVERQDATLAELQREQGGRKVPNARRQERQDHQYDDEQDDGDFDDHGSMVNMVITKVVGEIFGGEISVTET